MNRYSPAKRQALVRQFVCAVIDADGSIKAAAGSIGVHPNTVSSWLNRAGYKFQHLRKLACERKPVQSVMAADAARRVA